jgi:hypothetical protein
VAARPGGVPLAGGGDLEDATAGRAAFRLPAAAILMTPPPAAE